MNFTLQDLGSAPEGAIIVDEDGDFIAAKVEWTETPWYGSALGGWADSSRIYYHQAGLNWRLVIAEGLKE